MAQHLQDIAWLPEPHVAEAIFRMLQDAGVTVVLNRRLREKDGVRKSGARIAIHHDGERRRVHRPHLRRLHL